MPATARAKIAPMNAANALPDPRCFPPLDDLPPDLAAICRTAAAALAAPTRQDADRYDASLRERLTAALDGDGRTLEALVAGAPSVDVARHLLRQLDLAWREAEAAGGVTAHLFAVPVIVITGLEAASGEGTLPGVLDDAPALAAILAAQGALAGNRSFALANVLTAAEAIDLAALPALRAWQRLPDALVSGATLPARALPPAPLAFAAGREAVHLRFIPGTALARGGAELTADATVGTWGLPFTQALSRQLGGDRVSVLALPRAPARLLAAVPAGRAAQREVSAQLFASNAIRKLRASVGEPSAVISAHRTADAPGGGELRLSLSSPFEPRDAEGFRCPLYASDRVADVVAMLQGLLADCRVNDVRLVAGIHADRIAGTGLPLLFKPETLPAGGEALH
jgi:hypothetical protein